MSVSQSLEMTCKLATVAIDSWATVMALFPVKNGPQYRSENQYRAIYCHVCTLLLLPEDYCYGYINLIAEDEWPQRAAPSDLGSIYCGTILFITFKVPPVSVRQHSVRPKRQIGMANRSPVSSHCLSFFSRYTLCR